MKPLQEIQPSYRVCLLSGVLMKSGTLLPGWWAVRVDERDECVGEEAEAGKILVDGEQFAIVGMVAGNICESLKKAGRCPAAFLQIDEGL